MAFKGFKLSKEYLAKDILLQFLGSPCITSDVINPLVNCKAEKYPFNKRLVELSIDLAEKLMDTLFAQMLVPSMLRSSDNEEKPKGEQYSFVHPDSIVLDGDLEG